MSSKPKFERFGGSKVRTGCITCKQRRVKCDERKPICSRCWKAGRNCAGYAPLPPKDRNAVGKPLVIINYMAPEGSISLLPGVDFREKRSLEFFRTHTVLETFPTTEWPEHLLRTSFYEDAVRHAIVALGALHEHYQSTNQTDSDFAMRQYSKAMKQVMQLDMKCSEATDVALISCILFACFESLSGHYRSSLLHVNSGLQILKEQELANVANKKVAYVSKQILIPMFLIFVTQSREIGDVKVRLVYDSLPNAVHISPVHAFKTYHDAHSSMEFYLHEFVRFLVSLEPDPHRGLFNFQAIIEQHSALIQRHAAWSKAFEDLLERGPVATESEIAQLQIWRTVVDMTLQLDIHLGEVSWDGKVESFRKVLDYAGIVVKNQVQIQHVSKKRKTSSTPVSGPDLPGLSGVDHHEDTMLCEDAGSPFSEVDYCQTVSAWKPLFSLDLGIIIPLYITVSRCRDPAIRRRALQLLASCNRREGIWDSTLSARVGERIIAIEEEGATSYPVIHAHQIPEATRIRDLHTKFGIDRQVLIRYTKSVDCVGSDDKYEELLEW